MSEFQSNWPDGTKLSEHREQLQAGLEIINDRLLLPSDGRWNIAYGALAMGGQNGTVFAEGQPGAGKTAFGNIVFGEQHRVDVAATDTAETLEGYESPIDHKFVAPKMKLDQDDMRLFLNEISHLRDTGPLHKYWDGEELDVNGHLFDLTNASIYATANFPDGGRSKKIDPALRSRMGLTIVAGDNGKEIAAQLHGRSTESTLDSAFAGGILPDAKNRMRLRTAMAQTAPMDNVSGQYIANVLTGINQTGLLRNVDLTDRRTSLGWAQAVRAYRLVGADVRTGGSISAEDLARVATLALGSIASLNAKPAQEIANMLGRPDRTLTKLESAVLARRAVAGVAMHELIKMRDISRHDVSADEELAKFIKMRSYASMDDNTKPDEYIVASLLGSDAQRGNHDEQIQAKPKSRNPLRRFR